VTYSDPCAERISLVGVYVLISDLDRIQSDDADAPCSTRLVHMRRTLQETVIILGRKNTACIQDGGRDRGQTQPHLRPPGGRLQQGTRAITEPVSYYWLHFSTRLRRSC